MNLLDISSYTKHLHNYTLYHLNNYRNLWDYLESTYIDNLKWFYQDSYALDLLRNKMKIWLLYALTIFIEDATYISTYICVSLWNATLLRSGEKDSMMWNCRKCWWCSVTTPNNRGRTLGLLCSCVKGKVINSFILLHFCALSLYNALLEWR